MTIKLDLIREDYLGNYFNYHHFLKEWMIPLFDYLQENNLLDCELSINIEEGKNGQIHSNKWDEVIKQIFPKLNITHNSVGWEKVYLKPWKYDSRGEVSVEVAHSFREYILKRCNVKSTRKKAILIERYKHSNKMNRPGTYRNQNIKFIKNHKELQDSVCQKLKSYDLDFNNIFCENLTFREQVEYFYNTSIVIAVHGAALINILWMKPGSKVIEINIGHDFYWTKIISDMYGIQHFEIEPSYIEKNQEGHLSITAPVKTIVSELDTFI